MAAYLTLDEAKQYLSDDIYLSAYDDRATPGTPNDAFLQDDIDQAETLIDSFVKKLYDFDITFLLHPQSFNLLKGITSRLLDKFAYSRYDAASIPDLVQVNYDEAIFRLKDISTGKMLLVDATQAPRASSFSYSFNSANTDGTGRTVFDRDSMAGM